MKKVLIGLLVVVLLIGGGVFYVISNLDGIVKDAIETAGTGAIGSSVTVGTVDLDLMNGTAAIYDFSIANPTGFSNQAMVSFAELSISLDLNNLSGEVIGIRSIVARDPYIRYESVDGVSNLDTVNERLAGDSSEATSTESSAEAPDLAIASILIENIQASLDTDLLPSPLDVNLGDIRLENLSGSPEEISSQIMKPVISQLTASATRAVLSALAGMDLNDLQAVATQGVGDKVDELQEQATDAIDDALGEGVGDSLKEGLGNLLGR